jgi:hypothetical protein
MIEPAGMRGAIKYGIFGGAARISEPPASTRKGRVSGTVSIATNLGVCASPNRSSRL